MHRNLLTRKSTFSARATGASPTVGIQANIVGKGRAAVPGGRFAGAPIRPCRSTALPIADIPTPAVTCGANTVHLRQRQ